MPALEGRFLDDVHSFLLTDDLVDNLFWNSDVLGGFHGLLRHIFKNLCYG